MMEGNGMNPAGGLPGLGEALLRVAQRANGGEVPEAARGAMRALMSAFERAEDRGSVCVRASVAAGMLEEGEARFREGLDALERLGLLSRLPEFLEAARRETQQSGSGRFTPIVLDDGEAGGDARIYFSRFALEELDLARMLLALAADPPSTEGAEDDEAVARVTAAAGADRLQRRAVELALTKRLTIVSGGPGTGKTTTVAQILECLLERNPDLRIALAAPTGKATSRMLESINDSARRGFLPRLSGTLADGEGRPEAARRLRARTIHKWLATPAASGERPGPGNPLPADVLVVDEASMVDIHLAHRLLSAVGSGTRIVILGDKHQLAAVGPGAVFAELSDGRGVLRDHVVELKTSRRFQEGTVIARLAEAINHQGEAARLPEAAVFGRVLSALEEPGAPEDGYRAVLHAGGEASGDPLERDRLARTGLTAAARDWLDRELERYGERLTAFREGWLAGEDGAVLAGRADALWQALAQFRALAAQRTGAMGVNAVNAYAEAAVRALWPLADGRQDPANFPGRVVIIRKNDDSLNLHNGDVAIMLPKFTGSKNDVIFNDSCRNEENAESSLGPEAMKVAADPDGREDRRAGRIEYGAWLGDEKRMLPAALLPAHDTAWAMTIHQSQGSEFEHVALFLPEDPSSGLATRELLYTGVTRTRRTVDIFGRKDVLESAVRHRTVRDGALGRRLAMLVPDRPA